MFKSLLTPVVTAGVIAVMAPAAAAQQTVARLYVLTPMPGHAMALEQALAAHSAWRRDHNDPWSWTLHVAVAGDNVGAWYIRSAGHRWEDFDAYDNSEFGRQAFQHYMTTVAPHVAHTAAQVTTHDTTSVRWPEDQSTIRYVLLVDFHVKPDKMMEFLELVGKYHEAIVQTDHPTYYSFNFSLAGGDGYTVRLALPYDSWADMTPPEQTIDATLAEVYGVEEARAMSQRFNGALRGTTSTLVMVRPDLSLMGG